jgi:Tol biopolymer transport system component
VAAVELDAADVTLDEGATRRLVAIAKDAAGAALSDRAVTWASSAEETATVSAEGVITARRGGVVTITATAEGMSAAARVTVAEANAYDLVFDGLGGPGSTSPRYWEPFRLDLRAADAGPTRVMPWNLPAGDVAVSPDGRRIVFVASGTGGTDLFVANVDGSGVRNLTSTPESEDQPAWSPDGTKIAYHRWAYVGTPHDVWVMNADGTGAANLTADLPAEQRSPAWSPRLADGSFRLVFAHVTRGEDDYLRARLYTMRADGADKRAITADAGRMDDEPAWSPDGRSILFVRTGGEFMGDLWLVSPDGASERQLMSPAVDPQGDQRSPAWSPDGALIAFTSAHEIIGTRAGDWQVYTVRADGTSMVRRTSDPYDKRFPTWVKR